MDGLRLGEVARARTAALRIALAQPSASMRAVT
ncbi:hypothetical protein ABID95_006744 [Streptomyces atratus]